MDSSDRRCLALRAALAAVLVPAQAPELALIRRWLDSWTGIGLIAVGMQRQGFDVQLTAYGDGHWRATFYVTGLARAGRLDGAAATVASLHPPLERFADCCTHGRVVCFGVTHVDVQSNATIAEGKGLDGRDEARETSRQIVRPASHLRVIAHAVFSPQS
jgi:hypothetical protein